MGDDEVFSTGFTDNPWVGFVLGDVLANGLPQVAKDAGTACEMQACEIGVIEDHIACNRTVYGHQIDHPIGQSGSMQQFHDDVGRIDLLVRWFPHHHVAHQCGDNGQVSCNGREVEWGNGEYKAFEWAVFQPVPNPR